MPSYMQNKAKMKISRKIKSSQAQTRLLNMFNGCAKVMNNNSIDRRLTKGKVKQRKAHLSVQHFWKNGINKSETGGIVYMRMQLEVTKGKILQNQWKHRISSAERQLCQLKQKYREILNVQDIPRYKAILDKLKAKYDKQMYIMRERLFEQDTLEKMIHDRRDDQVTRLKPFCNFSDVLPRIQEFIKNREN